MNTIPLERSLSLSRQDSADGIEQFRLTIPKDFIDLLGWKKGDKINASLIVGGEMISLERDYRED